MTWWRVELTDQGTAGTVTRCDAPTFIGGGVVYIQAETAEEANRLAVREYARRKAAERRDKLKSQGRCKCGRSKDRDGFSYCSVCAERARATKARKKQQRLEMDAPRGSGKPVPPMPRDEQQRVANNLARQRDRRAEIRLEVLIEVRRHLDTEFNVACFRSWLEREIGSVARHPEAAE